MFSILIWLVFGFIAGSIAEWLWPPATEPATPVPIVTHRECGWAGGLAGSLVSGSYYQPGGLVLSVVGAIACMWVWRKLNEVAP
jgi:uncharacterized membrane protein YeaQ/YmgE (transglycosylase-associated protein family)